MKGFAVIQTGGKQYKVAEGDTLKIEKLSDVKDGKVTFDQVLLVDDEQSTKVGTPHVAGAKVMASVLGDGRHKKIYVVKYQPKSRYFKRNGHRQPFTEVKIDFIR
ncbi:MAG: 50S ribosomal protein L21 [Candidatus Lloydbacteria bacterium RIFCSPHIGHO2_02_FULL_54_17]|uniref:Large ribosomal subunit protein bL21 n=1 Tax=Candidatus Lloydbacteria bacterium RIFCSPHIGHO2_02_FULL_54_17 TaxID=1798664 RepID=A0A1G2DGX9_9BACT|nr:MAG: 50S ribosomal protein L21 [Candidatus Lloydbacteria bacterium RIFCSPHIGHO2_02_FULL_54_17]OGZ13534.1 MAG: 50S ribosomal protein L21 [Candidatus Lloydbacteria bacterium RIFCSPLOWO2_01_FULL_54_18]OGZ16205.1 MAG: 50S ribosomal protein L21 [Candidatus Lloydbacteria bacterium RIFCSPLOWO2_02_FULL_54_12]